MPRGHGRRLSKVLLILLAAAVAAAWFYWRHREQQRAAAAQEAARLAQLDARILPLLRRADAAPPTLGDDFPCVLATVSGGKSYPRIRRCPMPVQLSGPEDQFETDLRYGSVIVRQSDLYFADVFSVPLTRTYSSRFLTSGPLAFGPNTTHPFDTAPVGTRNPYTYMLLVFEDGNYLFFGRISAGTSYADAVFQHTETETRFNRAVIAWNGDGWTAWLTDGSKMRFPEAYYAKTLAQGAATEILDGSGHRLELRRDARRNLAEIRAPHGRTIKLTYDQLDRITRAEDDQGHWASYQYGAHSMLADVVSSTGAARHYSYDGTLMTRVEDESHRLLLQNWYDGSFVVRQTFGNGETYSYEYDWPSHLHHALSMTVTAADGTQQLVESSGSVPASIEHLEDR